VVRARLTVVLALLAVTAGCGTPALERASTSTEDVTPAPLPEGTPEAVVPGVTTAGVADATVLKEAHVAALRGGNFTVHHAREEWYANGSLRARTRLVARFPGDGRYLIERTFEGPVHARIGTGGTVRQYGDANGTVRLRVAADGTVLSRSTASAPGGRVPRTSLVTDPYSGRTVLLVLRGVDVDTVRPVEGRAAYRLRGSGVADRAALTSLLSPTLTVGVRNVSVDATVGETGLVERLRFAYTVTLRGEPVQITRTIRFTEVGTTTLDRPAWARAETATVTQATGVRSTTVPS
jgi:hypothetical protein